MLINLPPPGDLRRLPPAGWAHTLRGVVFRKGIDCLIGELACHPPHVSDRVGVAAALGTKIPELRNQIVGILARQTWKLGLLAVSTSPVTCAADAYREALRVRRGGRIRLFSGTRETR